MFRITDRRLAKYSALLAVPLLVGLLAACSTGDPKPEQSASSEKSFEDWQVSFASCMRDNGIDMPDPGKGGMSQALRLDEANTEAFQTASDTCIKKLGEPPAPPGGKKTEKEMLADQLKLAKCFRDNGIDVADPKEGQGLTIPEAPDDVMEKCGLGAGASGATSVVPAG